MSDKQLYVSGLLTILKPQLPPMIFLLGLSGRAGMSMILSLLSDFLSLFTIHIYLSYLGMATVFSGQLSIAGSLFRLFRGQLLLPPHKFVY